MKALPAGFSPVYLVYNPLLFKKYGVPEPEGKWVKEDFIRAAQKLTVDTNGDGILDLYGFSLSGTLNRWLVIALQQGVTLPSLPPIEPMENTLAFIHGDCAKRFMNR
ncbi:extracellular solute-binding protein [Paenibacillus oceani]|uniref:Extracellular solute-binding protein n=1 Tax=Paenibacillus oceani TaxID=2772510 RepID=A0A927C9R0_9BACL|nr:extracellular solute-binding protein [Paenibacillus oceani]MBD2864029.1 extracellular solute-binding protein [Paenibacillus oceani]